MENVPLSTLLNEIKRRVDCASESVPPALPCGHPCFTCESQMANIKPVEKQKRGKDRLIKEANPVRKVCQYEFCSIHAEKFEYWCCKCQVATCKSCPEVHYSHGIVSPKEMFQHEVLAKLSQSNFKVEGEKLSANITESINDCDRGLDLIKEVISLRSQLLRRKKHLLKLQQCLHDFTEDLLNEDTFDSLQAKHWDLARVLSCSKEHFKPLESQSRIICGNLSQFGNTGRLEKTQAALQGSFAILLPIELLPNATEWKIQGEYETRKALSTLHTSQNRPTGPVIIISSSKKPIKSLSELLITLAEQKFTLKVKLNDSFFASSAPQSDYPRLEPFFKKGHGSYLVSFLGHLTASELNSLDIRYVRKVGLRIDTAADAAILRSRPNHNCYKHIRVSHQVVPRDIKDCLPEGSTLVSFHFTDLKSTEIPWLEEVLSKLVPPNRKAAAYFPDCHLPAADVQRLLDLAHDRGVLPWIWMESNTLTEHEKKNLEEKAKVMNIEIKWKFQFL